MYSAASERYGFFSLLPVCVSFFPSFSPDQKSIPQRRAQIRSGSRSHTQHTQFSQRSSHGARQQVGSGSQRTTPTRGAGPDAIDRPSDRRVRGRRAGVACFPPPEEEEARTGKRSPAAAPLLPGRRVLIRSSTAGTALSWGGTAPTTAHVPAVRR